MKFSSRVVSASAAVLPLVNAFPAKLYDVIANDPQIAARTIELAKTLQGRQTGADAATALFEPVPQFNAADQYIDVSEGSGHEYVAPGPDDLRGPCPGLNAMANHGFLPHNGYATISQYIDATTTVVGMGPQLAGFLSILGAAIDGDLTAWSMGGTPSVAQGGLLGPLGNGLSGSHNKYESDASPTRPDLYEAGNDYITETGQFQDLINYCPGGQVDLDCLTDFRSYRFDQQIANNPYFFNGPFSGVAVQPAAYTFIFRYMANHSAEYPVGYLSYDTIASWFGIEGTNGNYNAVQGTERIPDNWYRRAQAYPYELEYFISDLINAAVLHPKFINIGGNTGTVNTFTGVSVTNLTGGLFNLQTLLEGNNLGCFIYQLSAQAKPDALLGALDTLTDTIGKLIAPLSCPQLEAIDESQLEQFPGYTKKAVYS
ncbi:hypothetical protein M409DRAFT_64293 [Zasmidium cellare ATCC 36951]|uniref:Heme haloperoxidase family profile domain-containing protein n=1 Tax=Zasmidium cellare ATCC 36951 TaxID=1080233 RepID=A0A6A6CV80_ZASCE|nr:uncharacterized protein M409DRAFT_64293 [Zasmidium cellare ATCC 36951]KAF2170623.1 hypothetical protein M409DRAFT_64293 [Zasmidium cellare ATCC 36951]